MEQKLLQLQPRLQKLADLVPEGTRFIDVGTDHGYLPVWLLQRGKIPSAIASDVGVEPLQHARRTAEEFGITEGLSFCLCDGLDGIELHNTDTVVIAGMGGQTIIHILSLAPQTKNGCLLFLQPMTKPELLRVWLTENGYCIRREHLVWDKDYLYPVMEVMGGERQPLSLAEEHGGVGLSEDPLYLTYLDQKILRVSRAIDGMRRGRQENREKIQELTRILQALEKEKGAHCDYRE